MRDLRSSVRTGAVASLGVALLWAVRPWLAARVLGLRAPTHGVRVDVGAEVTAGDGTLLATDVYQPVTRLRRRALPPGPTVLIRTPYGRRGVVGTLAVALGRRFAERGYRVVCQDVRGRFDSGGQFAPYIHERADGAATAAWIVAQPWSDGRIVTWGPSYLGYTQWALVAADDPHPAAMVPITTAADIGGPEGDEAVALETTLRWVMTIDAMVDRSLGALERARRIGVAPYQRRMLAPGFDALPLAMADEVVLGRPDAVWQTFTRNARRDDPLWQQADLTDAVGSTATRVHAVTGWDDLFLARQLEDHARLVAAGRDPHLTVGPWHHLDVRMQLTGLRTGMDWFDAHMRGRTELLREQPVRVWVRGAEEWRDLAAWPPPGAPTTVHLGAGGRLHGAAVTAPATTTLRYDPADPTPSLGGAVLSVDAGSVDNRTLEARPDVVVFTGDVLPAPLEVMGRACARLVVSASNAFHDVVVRLCDVHPDGASMNLADGFVRLRRAGDPREPTRIEVPLTPIAHRFDAGHRVRLQVAGGAHPRIARNLGTDEPSLRGTRMAVTDITVHHGEPWDSSLELPTVRVGGA